MLIQSITRRASVELLARANLGRLACAHQGQPYITPILFTYEDNWLYSFSTHGQKVMWMRANPLVCVEAEELVNRQEWATVIVLGRYEELPDTATHRAYRTHAHDLLQRRPVWWKPGYVKTVVEGKEQPLDGVYFRIRIDQITGRRGIPDTGPRARG